MVKIGRPTKASKGERALTAAERAKAWRERKKSQLTPTQREAIDARIKRLNKDADDSCHSDKHDPRMVAAKERMLARVETGLVEELLAANETFDNPVIVPVKSDLRPLGVNIKPAPEIVAENVMAPMLTKPQDVPQYADDVRSSFKERPSVSITYELGGKVKREAGSMLKTKGKKDAR